MKILFISMPSIHAIRWIYNLKDTSFELYWFDVLGRGNMETINRVHQFTDWERRKLPYLKGEYFLSRNYPSFFEKIEPFLKVTANQELEKIIKTIQPDIIHSFEMQSCSYPIIETMNLYPNIKWIYSCWGSDLFYYRQFSKHQKKIKTVLERINFMHADCNRDYTIAKELGFRGINLELIPGGSGFDLELYKKYKTPTEQRKTIVIKGYQHQFGRGLKVVEALSEMHSELQNFEVVVFGAHNVVIDYIKEKRLPFEYYHRHELPQNKLLALMGKSLIYIGNSISDGMPNTLLEAIVMGAFPIQSNPGGVTAELIRHGENGFLIENPESTEEIKQLIRMAISNVTMIETANSINTVLAQEKLEYEKVKTKIVAMYQNCNIV